MAEQSGVDQEGEPGMPNRIRGVLFDKDGTLFDFQATWAEVSIRVLGQLSPDPGLQEALATRVGFDLQTRRFAAGSPLVAASTAEIAGIWAELLPDRTVAEIEDLTDRAAMEAAMRGALVPAAPDLPGLLTRLRDRGLGLGVATHDSEASARHQLVSIGAGESFDFIAGYDSGFGLKPGPGMLLGFAEALGHAPGEIAMVGDSISDLAMVAEGGGALAIGVLTGPALHEDLAPHADTVLPSIQDLEGFLDRSGLLPG
ncbi:MAG: HAD family hydrolase [Pseudomonadota bacterium]